MDETLRYQARLAGKAPKHVLRFTISDLAGAAGKTVSAVQKARNRGRFDQGSLLSVAEYICKERGLHALQVSEQIKKRIEAEAALAKAEGKL